MARDLRQGLPVSAQDLAAVVPRHVAIAVASFSVALAIGVAILYFGWVLPTIALVCLVVIGLLILLAALRRNWARWTLVLVTLVSLVFNWLGGMLPFQLTYGGIISVGTALQVVLELVGCWLLFTAPARAWYRRSV